MNVIYLVIFSSLVAYVFKKLNVPGAFLVGSLIGAAIYTIFINIEVMPSSTKFFAQSITGAFIGSTIRKEDIQGIKKLIMPIFISISSMILGMLVSASVLYFIFNFDLPTALLSAVPGGISDITLMSIDFNADINTVALIQTMRLFSVLIFLPNIISNRLKNSPATTDKTENVIKTTKGSNSILLTLLLGLSGGYIGNLFQIPAGTLSISMLLVIVVNYYTNGCYLPRTFRSGAQIASGCLIGSGITILTVKGIPDLIIPIIVVLTFYLIFNFLVSSLINKTTKMDMATAMFATAPAGASDMVLIANEMDLGVNQTQIVLMHIARLISVVTIFPLIISLILKFTS